MPYSTHLQQIDIVSKREIGNFQSFVEAIFYKFVLFNMQKSITLRVSYAMQ